MKWGPRDNSLCSVAMMFIRNCPNPGLSSVFRCNPTSKWSAEEVQEAINEYERDYKSWKPVPSVPKLNQAIVAEKAVGTRQLLAVGSESLGVAPLARITGILKQMKVSESGTLERVLKMLEKVLECTTLPASKPKSQVSSWY